MPEPRLYVAGLGMISALAIGAPFNAAAMRCGYSGAERLSEHQDRIVAQAPLPGQQRGSTRLADMTCQVIREALQGLPDGYQTALYMGTETTDQLRDPCPNLPQRLRQQLDQQHLSHAIDYNHAQHVPHGRISFARAIQAAQADHTHHAYALIVGISSCLYPQHLNYYQGLGRLLGPDNPDAFIPGEAATAILLTTQAPDTPTSAICGTGFGTEPHPISGQQPVTGDALAAATRAAETASGITSAATDFRLSSASGEAYFFRELSIAQGRTLHDPKPEHPLWHPADHIGEVGAAVGGAIMVMAHYAFTKGYAPGPRALAQLSNDDTQRAAFLLERATP